MTIAHAASAPAQHSPRNEPSWVGPLRDAAGGKAPPAIELARGATPSWLASDTVHALTSILLAALVIAAAVLRSRLAHGAFDVIALLLRSASVAFGLRASIAIVRLAMRLARARDASSFALAWSAEGILLRDPRGDRWAARDEVLGFAVAEAPAGRRTGDSLQPLWVVLRPRSAGDPLYWELPPYFAASSEIFAARLARAFPPRHEASGADGVMPPALAPEERYMRAVRGQLGPDEIAIPEGFAYRWRAPYGVLLALVFVADALRGAGALRAQLWPAALAAAALAPATLLIWFAWMRARRAARLGIALVLTREELLIRGQHGVLSVPWTQLARAAVQARLAWSPFVGSYPVRVLSFSTLEGTHIPFDGAFLGVPPEVVATLAEAHRTGCYAAGQPS